MNYLLTVYYMSPIIWYSHYTRECYNLKKLSSVYTSERQRIWRTFLPAGINGISHGLIFISEATLVFGLHNEPYLLFAGRVHCFSMIHL